MFNNEKIRELQKEVNHLRLIVGEYTKMTQGFEKEQGKIINNVELSLIGFHKEITDRYFDTLERILKVHTESSLISALANQIGKKDLDNLKSSLLQPFLEAKWEKEKEEKGQRIVNKGVLIIEERNSLHNEILQKEKQGEDVGLLKEQLKGFDKVLEMIK